MKKDDTHGWHIDDLIKECAANKAKHKIFVGHGQLPHCPYITPENKQDFHCKYVGYKTNNHMSCYYGLMPKKEEKKK